MSHHHDGGVEAATLDDDTLVRELASLHATRVDTLRHGSSDAVEHSSARIEQLEREYLTRHPEREVDPNRLRAGARARSGEEGQR